ncbi:MAG: hypothetical protein KGS61_01085 [Verrucomicrobia bacterium]|nr:hypothetical protein [Verrucomicrobiota bacterium]
MRTLGDAELLCLWERGAGRRPWEQALLALATAVPEESCESLAAWPVGRRNQALARLRCRCFGRRLRAWLACTACGERLEFEMDAQRLAGEDTRAVNGAEEAVNINGRRFRLPTSQDLARAAAESDPETGARRIAEGCLLETGSRIEWSAEELAAIGQQLAVADPHAETGLTFQCPACGRTWEEALDIVGFFWTELEARIRQLLFAVHTLASVYGWSETDILGLSDRRRAAYLELAQA